MRRAALLVLPALLLACGRGSAPDAGATAGEAPPPSPAGFTKPSAPARADFRGKAADAAVPALQLPAGDLGAPAAAPAMIVRTGSATVEVDSLEPAVDRVRRLVEAAGGYVGNATLQAGRDQVRSATLQLRIPAPRFDQVVAGLGPVGHVESVDVSAEDVGEEFVDLTARVENARRLETRLLDLLGTRTGKLGDVLSVERELARVREEIERYEGRMRYLQTRASLSSLAVTLHQPYPLVGAPGDHPIADAFRQAWRNLVAVTAWLIASSGVLLPLALVGAVVIFLVRRRRRPAGPAESPA